jgi:hypothetical protein
MTGEAESPVAWAQYTRTPSLISAEIRSLCHDLIRESTDPVFLDANPILGAHPLQCFPVVAEYAAENGGALCVGWRIWEWPQVMIEAEFHGVWQSPNGQLRDLTTPAAVGRILFLPDPIRQFRGRQVNAVRRPLADMQEIRDLIKAEDDAFEFRNRPEFASLQGEVELTGSAAIELLDIRQRHARAIAELPCHCGSGRKVKDCHRPMAV